MSHENQQMQRLYNWLLQHKKHLLIPNIQRPFVWDNKQIVALFDSIYNDFFIGMFWIWTPNSDNIDKLDCFLINPNFSVKNEPQKATHIPKKPILIIDGQQRLTALSIGLSGSSRGKILCLNLKNKRPLFQFRKENDIDGIKWKSIKDVMTKRQDSANAKYFKKRMKEASIWIYTLDKKYDLTRVTEVFRRVNKGGTSLTNTQDFMSVLAPIWHEYKDEFQLVRSYLKEKKLTISDDFLIRTCLFCNDNSIKIKPKFSDPKTNAIAKGIKANWQGKRISIKQAIIRMANKLEKLGFSDSVITSYNALIPLAYMFFKQNRANKDLIEQYIYRSCLLQKYGKSSATALQTARNIMGKSGNLKRLVNSYIATESEINKILEYEKSKYTKLALKLLYRPSLLKNDETWHDDHMHPAMIFQNPETFRKMIANPHETSGVKKIENLINKEFPKWKKLYNKLPNLQPLPGDDNSSKNGDPLVTWVANQGKNFKRKHSFISERTDLRLIKFKEFFDDRKNNMKNKLKKELTKKY